MLHCDASEKKVCSMKKQVAMSFVCWVLGSLSPAFAMGMKTTDLKFQLYRAAKSGNFQDAS